MVPANVPAGQALQLDAPADGATAPIEHGVQAVDPGPLEKVPGWHVEHEVAPGVAENCPG